MSKLERRIALYFKDHKWQHRALVTALIVPSLAWQLWNAFTPQHWLQVAVGAVFVPVMALAYVVLVAVWRRNDTLDELAENVLNQTDDKPLSDVVWLWARYTYGLRTREVREMNHWLQSHNLGSTPVGDLPQPVKRMVLDLTK